jgi:hypothetical protein
MKIAEQQVHQVVLVAVVQVAVMVQVEVQVILLLHLHHKEILAVFLGVTAAIVWAAVEAVQALLVAQQQALLLQVMVEQVMHQPLLVHRLLTQAAVAVELILTVQELLAELVVLVVVELVVADKVLTLLREPLMEVQTSVEAEAVEVGIQLEATLAAQAVLV